MQALPVEVERFRPPDPLFLDEQRVLASMVVVVVADVGSYCWLSPGRSYVGEPAGFDSGGGALPPPGSFVLWTNRESRCPWPLLLVLMLALIAGTSLTIARVMSGALHLRCQSLHACSPPDITPAKGEPTIRANISTSSNGHGL